MVADVSSGVHEADERRGLTLVGREVMVFFWGWEWLLGGVVGVFVSRRGRIVCR